MGGPVGQLTRGTTGYNRLRRSDRWLVHSPRVRSAVLSASDPLVIDLGFGALPVTTLELAARLRVVRGDVRVVGLEIHPDRVATARAAGDGTVEFALGGFELGEHRPVLVRAFNVLRQYDAADVDGAWREVCGRLAPGGLFLEGTCDETGRRATWLLLGGEGPRTLTLAWDPADVERPSELAERLPKLLIHRNVPGEPVHDLLSAADRAWDMAAGWAPYGPRVRWRRALGLLAEAGEPVAPQRRNLRDNVLTVPVARVAPEYADGFA